MPVSNDMWVLVMVLETLTNPPLMFCSLIFQGEEEKTPPPFTTTHLGLGENVPFRSNRPIHGEAGGKKKKKKPRGPTSQDLVRLLPTS